MGKAWRAPDAHRRLKRYPTGHSIERLRDRIQAGSLAHRIDRDLTQWLDWATDSAIDFGRVAGIADQTRIANISEELGIDAYVVIVHDGVTKRGPVEHKIGERLATVLSLEQAVRSYGFDKMCRLMNPSEWGTWRASETALPADRNSSSTSSPLQSSDRNSSSTNSGAEAPELWKQVAIPEGVTVETNDQDNLLADEDRVILETHHKVVAQGSSHVDYKEMSWKEAREALTRNVLAYATDDGRLRPEMKVYRLVPVEAKLTVEVKVSW